MGEGRATWEPSGELQMFYILFRMVGTQYIHLSKIINLCA